VKSVDLGDLMFCNKCGSQMLPLKSPPWTLRYKCSSCVVRLEILCGDKMGGSSDTYLFFEEPFKEEIEVVIEGVEK
jgi:hypothetical protein